MFDENIQSDELTSAIEIYEAEMEYYDYLNEFFS